jgi:hypothetical protein
MRQFEVGQLLAFYPNSDDPETMKQHGKVVRIVDQGEECDDDWWYGVECVETGWSGDALQSELVGVNH